MDDKKGDFFYYRPMFQTHARERRPTLTFALIAVCTIAFIIDLLFSISDFLAFTPATVATQPWTIVTAVFMHASIDHLVFNMFALFIFGTYLETRVKPSQFLTVFFAAGILGNVAYWATGPLGTIPAVGASGAIYGVMGLLATLYPGLTVYVMFMPMPMMFAAALWFVLEFVGFFTPDDIAHQAHIAGLAAGVLYGLYLRRQRRKPVYFWEK